MRIKLATVWRGFANACAIILISLSISYTLVKFYEKRDPVIKAMGEIQPVKLSAVVGGEIIFKGKLYRTRACPGYRVITLTRFSQGEDSRHDENGVVHFRYPISLSPVGVINERTQYVDLPDYVGPGNWNMKIAVESTCPDGIFFDPLYDFNIEITMR
jgi:hypothetical protein